MSRIDMELFIDSHCHLFNISDIPILQTVIDKEKFVLEQVHHPLKALLLPAVFFKRKFIKKQQYKFISFFESEIETNARNIDKSLNITLSDENHQISAGKKIITPLIMDFDRNGFVANGNPEKIKSQVVKLVETIKREDIVSTIILPFIAVDPRRFVYEDWSKEDSKLLGEGQISTNITNYINDFSVKTAINDISAIETGDICGIKLYPSLGWDLFPSDENILKSYAIVLKKLVEFDVPITVHCQKASFELGIDSDKGNEFTDPFKWNKLLANTALDLKNIRLNLAHFGGEEGVKKIADFRYKNGESEEKCPYGPRKKGWTYEIIKLIKNYDNTYADLAAFDWCDKHAVASLLWILFWDGKQDEDGEFYQDNSPNHKIINKLLWGTDIPMVLDAYRDYHDYFSSFFRAIDKPHQLEGNDYEVPAANKRYKVSEIINQLACNNPKRFHFKEN
ncbi:MAG: amidohydrolase family protein [Desulfobulbaceae bacterium]|nr:amidohydrolase family protein [Desulfobulbaceae bacterium]